MFLGVDRCFGCFSVLKMFLDVGDVLGCWRMFFNVFGCFSVDVLGMLECWRMVEDVFGCWKCF